MSVPFDSPILRRRLAAQEAAAAAASSNGVAASVMPPRLETLPPPKYVPPRPAAVTLALQRQQQLAVGGDAGMPPLLSQSPVGLRSRGALHTDPVAAAATIGLLRQSLGAVSGTDNVVPGRGSYTRSQIANGQGQGVPSGASPAHEVPASRIVPKPHAAHTNANSDAVACIQRYLLGYAAAAQVLLRIRCRAVIVLQRELSAYVARAGATFTSAERAARRMAYRAVLLGRAREADDVISAAVTGAREIATAEHSRWLELRRAVVVLNLWCHDTAERAVRAQLVADEARERRAAEAAICDLLPPEAVRGTAAYDEARARAHIEALHAVEWRAITRGVMPGLLGDLARLELDARLLCVECEAADRLALLRTCRAAFYPYALALLAEADEPRRRAALEAERAMYVSHLKRHSTAMGVFFLIGPGPGSEFDGRVAVTAEWEDGALSLFNAFVASRTRIGAMEIIIAEGAARRAYGGVAATEARERALLTSAMWRLRLVLLQGESGWSPHAATHSEEGARRMVAVDEYRHRRRILADAAALYGHSAIPTEERAARSRLVHEEAAAYSTQLLAAAATVLIGLVEPSIRSGISAQHAAWVAARVDTAHAHRVLAAESAARATIEGERVLMVNFLAGAEYLMFLELRRRNFIIADVAARAARTASIEEARAGSRLHYAVYQSPLYEVAEHDFVPFHSSGTTGPASATMPLAFASSSAQRNIMQSHQQQQPLHGQHLVPIHLRNDQLSHQDAHAADSLHHSPLTRSSTVGRLFANRAYAVESPY